MKRRAFLAALGLAPFFKWIHGRSNAVPRSWFISEFKYFHKAWDGERLIVLHRRDTKVVDKPEWVELQVPH